MGSMAHHIYYTWIRHGYHSISFHLHPVRGGDTPFARPGLWRLLCRGRKCRWGLVALENVGLYDIISTYLNISQKTQKQRKKRSFGMFWELSGVYSWLCGWRQCNTSAIVLLGTLDGNLVLGIWMVLISLSYRSQVTRSGPMKEIVLRSTNMLHPEEAKHGVEMCGRHDKNGAYVAGLCFPGAPGAHSQMVPQLPWQLVTMPIWGTSLKDVLHHVERQEDRDR